ncbi:hypothetical protein [Alteromonas facilis]|uniref:hypothetical protein n=1 Tax=Alteromonas facilis TaxID=2048004 RepID=UPI000C2857EC|nr:hypothetical protein [Alteromonas facilis]
MLTNTVIVFLRDFLPIFILLTYLTVFTRAPMFSMRVWAPWVIPGLLLAFAGLTIIEAIAQTFDGAGLEITNSALLLLSFVALLVASIMLMHESKNRSAQWMLLCGTCLFVTYKLIELFIFFGVFWQKVDSLQDLLIGCIVGVGICVSFSALLHFLLTELFVSRLRHIVIVMWCAFLAGQFGQITGLLSQVDLLSLGAPVFNFNQVIADSSEYGHVLNALVGYEASPTSGFLWVYFICFACATALCIGWDRMLSRGSRSNENE